jgi:hypothetical protein
MTDEQIAEIYSLGRESFFGGQRAFQLQAYPFKMTPVNMARHRNNPNMPFWKMIKEGYDHFEVTRQEPKVEFCEAKYVFDPAPTPGVSKPPVFNASAKCPAYVIPDEIAEAVRDKQRQDDIKTAELIAKGTPVAQRRPDIDGGMHSVFASKIPDGSTGLSEAEGSSVQASAFSRAPGTIPPHVNPPKATAALAPVSDEPVAAISATPAARVANASATQNRGFLSNLAQKVGIGGSDTTASTTSAKSKPAPAKPVVAAAKPTPMPAAAPASKPAEAHQVATAKPALKPSLAEPASSGGTLSGAAPVVSSNSFDSRFSAMR